MLRRLHRGGLKGYRNESQHRKLTLERKKLPTTPTMCSFKRGNAEGANYANLYLMFVQVCFVLCLHRDLSLTCIVVV